MNCEIVTIGSELLRGQITDTNATYLAQNLNAIGFNVSLHTSVGDDFDQMKQVISEAVTRSDLIIATGGLGPTEDDLTREVIADLAGAPLVFKQELMDQIESIFTIRGYRMPGSNRKQAFIPEGAIPISNDIGTAPGFMVTRKSKLLVALPGVPKELAYLFHKEVVPYLKKHFHLDRQLISSKVLRITGLGESKVDTLIRDLMNPHTNPRVGILASPGDIRVVITASGKDREEASSRIKQVEEQITARLGNAVYGSDEDTLEGVVTHLLKARGASLGIVETFTGGELTARLQKTPSSPLVQSIIANEISRFHSLLETERVPPASDGETARVLANMIRGSCGSSIGLAVVGVLKEMEKDYQVDAHVAVTGERVNGSYSWKMGADLPTLQVRGAIIALNTLRLALI
ncbi:MAG: competence/damage-inducible protein A [Deltaproteobacteria bacterium]|nr:CinA family nicotinamide mononucleotide deamidase-related protein [Deltaproteobacteria bacterium]MBW2076542.1 CinA family nicotinamide mononucleotide deamidase-related protein [Deltaproteobacteria bacterium]MBW2310206.1 CinA family nicotinamide mononucleotide deamidase-related protein [Deltaproteobacteria bacterium]RLB32077.1 MAG: competence/damage-inducible protein A [Deltaproteobacteria bacterium]